MTCATCQRDVTEDAVPMRDGTIRLAHGRHVRTLPHPEGGRCVWCALKVIREQLAQERAGAAALRAGLERVGETCEPGGGGAPIVTRALRDTDAGREWLEAARVVVRRKQGAKTAGLLAAIESLEGLISCGPDSPAPDLLEVDRD